MSLGITSQLTSGIKPGPPTPARAQSRGCGPHTRGRHCRTRRPEPPAPTKGTQPAETLEAGPGPPSRQGCPAQGSPPRRVVWPCRTHLRPDSRPAFLTSVREAPTHHPRPHVLMPSQPALKQHFRGNWMHAAGLQMLHCGPECPRLSTSSSVGTDPHPTARRVQAEGLTAPLQGSAPPQDPWGPHTVRLGDPARATRPRPGSQVRTLSRVCGGAGSRGLGTPPCGPTG